jgi:hypothetical protein
MADTLRTLTALLALFADNTTQDISPQDQRDFIVSLMGAGGQVYTSGGSTGVSVGTSYVELPFTTNGQANSVVADATNNRLEVGALGDGTYLVLGQFSFSGSLSTTFTLKAAINGTENNAVSCKRKLGTGGDVGSCSFVGLLTLAEGDYVTTRIVADAALKTFTPVEASLVVRRLW